jgi:hypothetical protein
MWTDKSLDEMFETISEAINEGEPEGEERVIRERKAALLRAVIDDIKPIVNVIHKEQPCHFHILMLMAYLQHAMLLNPESEVAKSKSPRVMQLLAGHMAVMDMLGLVVDSYANDPEARVAIDIVITQRRKEVSRERHKERVYTDPDAGRGRPHGTGVDPTDSP